MNKKLIKKIYFKISYENRISSCNFNEHNPNKQIKYE